MKTFEVRTVFFIRDDNDVVGGQETNRHCQGSIFLTAERKADALATLESFGYRVRPNECKIGMGLGMEALLAAEVITADTLTLVSLDGRKVGKASVKDGARVAERIGDLEVDRGGDSYGYKFIAS